MDRVSPMTSVAQVREEVAALASALRAQGKGAEAATIEAFNSSFWTTTTEYLVELLNVLDRIGSAAPMQSASISARVDSVKSAARRLSNLK